jgi:type II secretory pathway pseudopilin PulG
MKNGFTIIELIISIFVLSIAIVGVFSALSVMIILTSDTSDRLAATYLAQEGIEIVRNIRDTNWLNMDSPPEGLSPTWTDSLTGCDTNSAGCEADYTTTGSVSNAITHNFGRYLNINTDGFYGYASGTPAKYKRKIIITPVTDVDGKSDHIIKVTAQVSWNEKATILNSGVSAGNCCPDPANPSCPSNVSNCIAAEETLYDWYNYATQ